MKMDLGLWIIGFISIVSCNGDVETIIRLKVELDHSSCEEFKASNNPIQLIDAVKDRLQEQEDVKVLATCYVDCVQAPIAVCGGKNTTYTLMFKVSKSTIRTDRLLKPISRDKNPHGFTCAKMDTGTANTCVPYGTVHPIVGPKRWMPTNVVHLSPFSNPSRFTETLQDSPSEKSNTPLIAGIVGGVAAAAGLLAGSGLLYRKLRKNNSVSDESDTTGILGTPVYPFGEAPSSIAPAGTS